MTIRFLSLLNGPINFCENNQDADNFIERIINGDKKGIQNCDIETKEQSKQVICSLTIVNLGPNDGPSLWLPTILQDAKGVWQNDHLPIWSNFDGEWTVKKICNKKGNLVGKVYCPNKTMSECIFDDLQLTQFGGYP